MSITALLDSGATCSAIPEEMAVTLLTHALKSVEAGDYAVEDDPRYPIRAIHRIQEKSKIDGSAANAVIEIGYAVSLRCHFIMPGEGTGPHQDIYFKVFPKGKCNIPGLIIGFPVLGTPPLGLGHVVGASAHTFQALSVSLPRLELGRRAEYHREVKVYNTSAKGHYNTMAPM